MVSSGASSPSAEASITGCLDAGRIGESIPLSFSFSLDDAVGDDEEDDEDEAFGSRSADSESGTKVGVSTRRAAWAKRRTGKLSYAPSLTALAFGRGLFAEAIGVSGSAY